MAENRYSAIFDQAVKKAETAKPVFEMPTLKMIADIARPKFTEEAGFTVRGYINQKEYYTTDTNLLTELEIQANNAIAGGGTMKISAYGDGTFNLKLHLGDHDRRTSIEDVLEKLASFYVHYKNPTPAAPKCGCAAGPGR